MALRDQRDAALSSELRELIGQCGAVLDGAEVTSVTGTEPVTELVDGPQVDAGSVQREAVAVIDAGVFAEAVQEDDRGARLGGCLLYTSDAADDVAGV